MKKIKDKKYIKIQDMKIQISSLNL